MNSINDRLPATLAANPLQSMKSDSDIDIIAEAVIHASVLADESNGEAFFKTTAKNLLSACLGYLRDWCSLEQRTFENLSSLLRAAIPRDPHNGSTDLDALFLQIESGCKRVVGEDGITVSWEPSGLVRGDGVCPRDTNGIRAQDDFSLGCYKRFVQGCFPSTRTSIALPLLAAVKGEKHGN